MLDAQQRKTFETLLTDNLYQEDFSSLVVSKAGADKELRLLTRLYELACHIQLV